MQNLKISKLAKNIVDFNNFCRVFKVSIILQKGLVIEEYCIISIKNKKVVIFSILNIFGKTAHFLEKIHQNIP